MCGFCGHTIDPVLVTLGKKWFYFPFWFLSNVVRVYAHYNWGNPIIVNPVMKMGPHLQFQLRACLHVGGKHQVGEVTCGGLPHLTCKHDHIKVRDKMDRQVTPSKQVTFPIWGTPLPCKQALSHFLFVHLPYRAFQLGHLEMKCHIC